MSHIFSLSLILTGLMLGASAYGVRMAVSNEAAAKCEASSKLGDSEVKICSSNYTILGNLNSDLDVKKSESEKGIGKNFQSSAPVSDIDKGAQCSRDRVLALSQKEVEKFKASIETLETSLNGRIQSVEQSEIALSNIEKLSGPMLCLGRCELAKNSRSLCIPACKILPKAAAQWESAAAITAAKFSANPQNFASNVAKSKKEIGELKKYAHALRDKFNGIKSSMDSSVKSATAERAILKEKYGCELAEDKAKQASRLLTTEKDNKGKEISREDKNRGTGFYAKTVDENGKEKYHFVSAEHVPDRADLDKNELNLSELSSIKGGEEGILESERFTVEPGKFDKGTDIVTNSALKREEALPLASANEQPKVGQEFLVNGFPGKEGRSFTSYSCTFQGYTPSYHGTDAAYLMNCPTAGGIGGASGGPVMDTSGKVWGVVSAENKVDLTKITVAPISSDSNGNLKYGIQNTFVTKDCYKTGSKKKQSCQIIPGATFSQVP